MYTREPIHVLLALLLAAGSQAQPVIDTNKIRGAGDAAVASKDWDTAIASFRQLVAADPKDARAWHMLGYSLHSNGDLDAALQAHLKAAEFVECAPIASYNVACVYALRFAKSADPRNKDEALTWLEKAASLGFDRAERMMEDTDMDVLRGESRYKAAEALVEKNAAESPRVHVFAGTFERKLARMVLFGGRGAVGGVSVSYGQPRWLEEYEEEIESPKRQNKRWRFGKDEWTTLDANVPLSLGDQKLAPGMYYLTLERRGGDFVLAAIDPATVRTRTIDPYQAHLTTGGTEVILKHERVEDSSDVLDIKIAGSMASPGSGEFVVRFGPHRLSVKMALHAKGGDKTAK